MDFSVTTKEFMVLSAKEPVDVLDLRDPEFVDSFDLSKGSNVIHIPLTQLPNRLDQLDKGKTYYLFTQFGGRSKTMTAFLRDLGYHVVNVIGGISAYKQYRAS